MSVKINQCYSSSDGKIHSTYEQAEKWQRFLDGWYDVLAVATYAKTLRKDHIKEVHSARAYGLSTRVQIDTDDEAKFLEQALQAKGFKLVKA